MGFFYTAQEAKEAKAAEQRAKKAYKNDSSRNEMLSRAKQGCKACPLNDAKLHHPKMLPTGAKHPIIYILGEAPGKEEDKKGEQFVGAAGSTLRDEIPDKYLSKIRWNNTIRCRPQQGQSNRAPEPIEVECCRRLQIEDIETTKPRAIFGFGAVPLKWITGNNSLTITPWRGRRLSVTVGKHTCWYYPMWHPSYINRIQNEQQRGDEYVATFKRDMARTLNEVFENDLPVPYWEPPDERRKGIKLLLPGKATAKDLKKILHEAAEWDELGIDIETHQERPYDNDSRILSIAISNYETTYAFSYAHPEMDWAKEVKAMVREFLLRSGKKWAHSLMFELEWLAHEFGTELTRETAWGDTMGQAYILDEREGAKSLGDVTIQHMGFDVKAESNVDNKRLLREQLHLVLPYNALDAKYCFAASHLLRAELEAEGLTHVYEEQERRIPSLVITQLIGLVPDDDAISKMERQYADQENKATEQILRHKDIAAWIKKGNKFEPSSNKDWLTFLKSKFPDIENVQEETLEALDYAPVLAELDRRRAHKLLSTYLRPYKTGGHAVRSDGKIHTKFNPNKTTTRRLSSEDPNGQNIPIRKTPQVRGIIKAAANCLMAKADYGQLEARLIAMASKDKVLVKQIRGGYDIHSDWTVRLAEDLEMRAVTKQADKKNSAYKAFRDTIKNGWTFPLFFGSSASSVARNIVEAPGNTWEYDKQGRPKPRPWFYDRVAEFWNQYQGVRDWQNDMQQFYNEHGYVQTLTGFRRHAPLSWNELINQPIQGSASDIVIDGMNRISERAHKEDMHIHPVLNVHDELDFYLPDDSDLEERIEIIGTEMCSCKFEFINVPLVVEMSIGPNWYEQEEIAVFDSSAL